MNVPLVRLLYHVFSGTLELVYFAVTARTADAAAVARHALDKVAGKASHLQHQQRTLAGICTVAAFYIYFVGDTLFLHALQDSVCYAAAVAKPFAKGAGLLVGLFCLMDRYAFARMMARISPYVIA